MINLIPPAARRAIVREYWVRVISVWMFLVGTGFLVVAALLLPTYVLIRSQIATLTETSSGVAEKVATYDSSVAELKRASELAAILVNAGTSSAPFSEYVTLIKKSAGTEITIRSIDFSRATIASGVVVLTGESKTRQALASFRDALESEGTFTKVDLPISNLIKDRDVLFSMQMNIATNTPQL